MSNLKERPGSNRKRHDRIGRETVLRANPHLMPLVELWANWLDYWGNVAPSLIDAEEALEAHAMVMARAKEILGQHPNLEGAVNLTHDIARDLREQTAELPEGLQHV